MRTIYLKSSKKNTLISDINQVIENYNGEIEFSNGIIHGHYIGKIPKTKNELGEVTEWLNGFHANLLVPNDFDESIFASLVIPTPENPVHQFA
jgi:hypothetical protein